MAANQVEKSNISVETTTFSTTTPRTSMPSSYYPSTFTGTTTPSSVTTGSVLSSQYTGTGSPRTTTPYGGSSLTTPCTETDGMDNPMYIPDSDIRTNDENAPGSLRYCCFVSHESSRDTILVGFKLAQ